MRSPGFRSDHTRRAAAKPANIGPREARIRITSDLHLPPFAPCPMLSPQAGGESRSTARSGTGHEIHRTAHRRRGLSAGSAAHPADDDADRPQSDAGVSAGDRRARRQVRRRAGAAVRPRALQLPRARRARQPLRPLGAGAGHPQGRHHLPADAEPAGVPGDLARRHAASAAWWRCSTPISPARRWRTASMSVKPLHIVVAAELLACARQHARGSSAATRRSGCTAMPTRITPRIDHAVDRLSGRRPHRRGAPRRSPSRTARSTSTPPAPPACPRPRTSTTTG